MVKKSAVEVIFEVFGAERAAVAVVNSEISDVVISAERAVRVRVRNMLNKTWMGYIRNEMKRKKLRKTIGNKPRHEKKNKIQKSQGSVPISAALGARHEELGRRKRTRIERQRPLAL